MGAATTILGDTVFQRAAALEKGHLSKAIEVIIEHHLKIGEPLPDWIVDLQRDYNRAAEAEVDLTETITARPPSLKGLRFRAALHHDVKERRSAKGNWLAELPVDGDEGDPKTTVFMRPNKKGVQEKWVRCGCGRPDCKAEGRAAFTDTFNQSRVHKECPTRKAAREKRQETKQQFAAGQQASEDPAAGGQGLSRSGPKPGSKRKAKGGWRD